MKRDKRDMIDYLGGAVAIAIVIFAMTLDGDRYILGILPALIVMGLLYLRWWRAAKSAKNGEEEKNA